MTDEPRDEHVYTALAERVRHIARGQTSELVRATLIHAAAVVENVQDLVCPKCNMLFQAQQWGQTQAANKFLMVIECDCCPTCGAPPSQASPECPACNPENFPDEERDE